MRTMIARNALILSGCTALLWMTRIVSAAGFDEPKDSDQPVEAATKPEPAESLSSPAAAEAQLARVPVSVRVGSDGCTTITSMKHVTSDTQPKSRNGSIVEFL